MIGSTNTNGLGGTCTQMGGAVITAGRTAITVMTTADTAKASMHLPKPVFTLGEKWFKPVRIKPNEGQGRLTVSGDTLQITFGQTSIVAR